MTPCNGGWTSRVVLGLNPFLFIASSDRFCWENLQETLVFAMKNCGVFFPNKPHRMITSISTFTQILTGDLNEVAAQFGMVWIPSQGSCFLWRVCAKLGQSNSRINKTYIWIYDLCIAFLSLQKMSMPALGHPLVVNKNRGSSRSPKSPKVSWASFAPSRMRTKWTTCPRCLEFGTRCPAGTTERKLQGWG